MIRAMFQNARMPILNCSYIQSISGPYFLVAPIYQQPKPTTGNDIRNGIYSPEGVSGLIILRV